MTYLLDTHVWLWLVAAPERIASAVLSTMENPETRLLLSAASSWEIAIKFHLGLLSLPEPPQTFVPDRMRQTGVDGLAVTHSHALRVASLPAHHRDPFDRLLVAQAQAERLSIITADATMQRYEVNVLSAV